MTDPKGHTPTLQPNQSVLILGAGPTGLGAAHRLRELNHENFTVIERHPYAGGLAHSFTDDAGFTWDIGGHVMFSHYQYYDDLFEKMMGDEFTLNNRESWVRVRDTWVPYPFQNNIKYLPPEDRLACLRGLIHAQLNPEPGAPTPKTAANFGEFIDAVFGDGIAEIFMRPYNFKVWAHPPELMNKHWIGERVAVLDVDRALKNVVLDTDDFGWGPNNQFKYPLKGGTGEFYSRIAQGIADRTRTSCEIASINVDTKTATLATGESLNYDTLISTMPLDVLVTKILTGDVPEHVRAAAAGLRHSGAHIVGIGIKRPCPSTKSWMYFPDANCPFYRVTYLSNYSPFMTPNATGANDTHYSLLCETSYSDHKHEDTETIVERTIQGLENAGMLEPNERDDIVDTWHYNADYAYPTPSIERDDILSVVIPWLESKGIYSRGRFGMWKYEVANTDHTLMQGVELVNRLAAGETETTIGIVYKSTEDGREAATHERSRLAGSGEKRLIETKPAPQPSN